MSRFSSSLRPASNPAVLATGFLLLIALLPFASAFAQSPLLPTTPAAPAPAGTAALDAYGRTTPQSSILNFLQACRAGDFRKASHYLDLRDHKAEDRLKDGSALAQQLLEVLDRDSQFDLADLSNDPAGDPNAPQPGINQLGSFVVDKTKIVLQLARIDTRSGSHIWVVSSESLKNIPALATQATETPIEKLLPAPLVTITFLDTPLWQWILYALIIAALVVASGVLSRFVLTGVGFVLRKLSSSLDSRSVQRLVGPLRLLLSLSVFRAAMGVIGGSALLRLYFGRGMTFLLFAGTAWLAAAIVDGVADRLRGRLSSGERAISYSIFPLVRRILNISLFVFAILATLASWGYNTTALLAGLGVGGLAVALAAQKTLENLFGGVSVITDRPVLVGDTCRFGNQTGVVEEIGLRSTRIRTGERSLLAVPNAQFSAMVLENLSARDRFLFHQLIHLRWDASATQIRAVMDGIAKLLDAHPKVDPGTLPVRFVAFGDYSHHLEVIAYVKTMVEEEFLAIQTELLVSILSVIESAGTALAVPLSETINIDAPKAPTGPGSGNGEQPDGGRNGDAGD
jgi:MscS family membrane protein